MQKVGFIMTNFIKSLIQNPKGNGIVRQLKQAEHQVAVEKAKKAGYFVANSAILGGITAPFNAMIGNEIAQAFITAPFICSWSSFLKKGAMDGIKNAKNKCNALKASEEYKAILARAKKIKSTN